jgi:hypothetical protein
MITIPMSPNYVTNREKLQHDDLLPCICCGKPVKTPKHFVRVFWGDVAVMANEAEALIAKEGSGGDLGLYPVGNSCYRKYAALKPYCADAKATLAEEEEV